MFKAWASHRTIDRVPAGVLEDLTAKFYSSEHNLHDESYYENVGRCQEVNQVLTALVRGQRFIEILGNYNTGKSTLLQEVCWISQTKYLFKFGVFIFRLSDDKDTSLVKF
jgi:predicted ATP-dependent serine protease